MSYKKVVGAMFPKCVSRFISKFSLFDYSWEIFCVPVTPVALPFAQHIWSLKLFLKIINNARKSSFSLRNKRMNNETIEFFE